MVFFMLLMGSGFVMADQIRIAVASNFIGAMTVLSETFELKTGHQVVLMFGSTGKHYAQIRNGAPFDLFFSADQERPERLENEGIAVPETRFTYAVGKVVLWSPKPDFVDSGGSVLKEGNFRYLAIANPRLAPYGRAAQEILESFGLWETLQGRLVRGENIGQTFQYVKSGNADLGFVAFAQIQSPGNSVSGSWWTIPKDLYLPIRQQAVLLIDSNPARAFLTFVKSHEAREIIREYGYSLP